MTTVLQSYLKNEAGYLTFDDLTEEISAKEDLKMFLELHRGVSLFDEIQYVPDLLRYIKMEVDNCQPFIPTDEYVKKREIRKDETLFKKY